MALQEDQMSSHKASPDLLKFSGSLFFWSICTALSLTGVLRQSGVTTPSGAWSELERLYHATAHAILAELPPALGLPAPSFTPYELARFTLMLVAMMPFV